MTDQLTKTPPGAETWIAPGLRRLKILPRPERTARVVKPTSYRVLETRTYVPPVIQGQNLEVDSVDNPAQDQSSLGVEQPVLPDGYSVGPWVQGLVGPGLWVAETTVKRPDGVEERVMFSSAGGFPSEQGTPKH